MDTKMDNLDVVNFTLSKVPVPLWRRLRHLALDRDQSVRQVLLDLIAEAVEEADDDRDLQR
jgi:hypothetical protein